MGAIVLFSSLFSQEIQWGETVRTDISKVKVEELFGQYVDENYPQKVIKYQAYLAKLKEEKIKQFALVTFVKKDLMWQDDSDTTTLKLNFLEFNRYCKDLNLANRKDWRTPTYNELLELVNYEKKSPASIPEMKNILPLKYWSNSQSVSKKDFYWYVDFQEGTTQIEHHLQKNHIRCVRNISSKDGEY